jgi:hypothetical protein
MRGGEGANGASLDTLPEAQWRPGIMTLHAVTDTPTALFNGCARSKLSLFAPIKDF